LHEALGLVDTDASATSGKGDPFILRLHVEKQVEALYAFWISLTTIPSSSRPEFSRFKNAYESNIRQATSDVKPMKLLTLLRSFRRVRSPCPRITSGTSLSPTQRMTLAKVGDALHIPERNPGVNELICVGDKLVPLVFIGILEPGEFWS
jgi:hypothetical protein